MKSYDKTLTRLILILTKLSNNEQPTPKELSTEFGVGIRTIQRDLYERLAYFPIEKNTDEALQFIDGFSLDRSTLENDEMFLVYLSLSQMKNISQTFESKIDNIFAKLLTPSYKTHYHIKAQSFEKIGPNKKLLKDIEFCIENQYKSILKIKNKDELEIDPYKIVSFCGLWYLLAKDKLVNKTKSFLISNIDTIKHSNKIYILDKPIDEILSNVHSAWFDDGNSFEVIVYIHEEVSYFFKLKNVLPTQKILEENDNGSIIVSFEVSHYEDIDNIIKAWLPHIEVLEPNDYKEKIQDELTWYLENLNITKDLYIK